MRKKVLILANNSDGLYRFRHELIEALKHDYEVIASTPFDNFVPELEEICDRLIQTEFDRRGVNPVKDLRLIYSYARIIKTVSPDLVITYTIKPNIYGGITSRIKRVPYAVNITGLGSAFEKNGVLQKIVVVLYRFALKRAHTIFFENSGDRDLFAQKTKVPHEKIWVLNGAGVNTGTYYYQPYPHNNIIRFLFIGRVMREKGIQELLDAGRRLVLDGCECMLDIVGPCEENYMDILAECENEGWLKYHGSQNDVRPFIEKADCFVLPSWHEGMANTNLECASSGRPVITSRIHGCMEAVVEGSSGLLCEAKNAKSLYQTMKDFCQLPWEERKAMGERGRAHMEDVFDKKQVVRETLERLGI